MNEWDDWAKELCDLVDELAKMPVSTDTPLFTFQQTMINACRNYKKSKDHG